VIAVNGPGWQSDSASSRKQICEFCYGIPINEAFSRIPLIVVVDDADFCAQSLDNFLWVAFTRSNPASDIYGVGENTIDKHWGCRGSLVIDARLKSHHAPPLIDDPQVSAKIDAIAARRGPLSPYL
jgi:4-hydroxy-3-polyprenylbenzoate decarboxylase